MRTCVPASWLLLLAWPAPGVADPPLPATWQPVGPAAPAVGAALARRLLPPIPEALVDDWELMLRVRAAYWADFDLGPLNLGVVARAGAVELFGTVPSAALRERAVELARQVRGVRAVQDRLQVRGVPCETKPPPRRLPPFDQPAPAAPDLPHPPGALDRPVGRLSSRHRPDMPKRELPATPPIVYRPTLPAPGVWQSVDGHPPPARPPAPVLLAPMEEPAVVPALDRLLWSNVRFRGVRFTVRGGCVELSGTVASPADLDDLRRAVTQLPGVDHACLDGVRVEPVMLDD
jgi:hypothetical protein